MRYYQCEVCCELLNDSHLLFPSESQVKEHIQKDHTMEQLIEYVMGYTNPLSYELSETLIKNDGYKVFN